MTLEEALNKAAGELPEGCTIAVIVENGAGWVECSDADGSVQSLDQPDATMAEQVIAHLDLMKEGAASDI